MQEINLMKEMNEMNRTKEAPMKMKESFRYAAIGGGIGLLVTMVLLIGISTLVVSGVIGMELSDALVICAALAGAAVGGNYSAKRMGRGVVVGGLAAAGVYVAVLVIASIFTANSSSENGLTLKIIIAALCGGAFGGVVRLYRRDKKSKARRRK